MAAPPCRCFPEEGATFYADSDRSLRGSAPSGGLLSYDSRWYTDTTPSHKILAAKASKNDTTNTQSPRNHRFRMQLPDPYCTPRDASYRDELHSLHEPHQLGMRYRHDDGQYLNTCSLEGNLPHSTTGRNLPQCTTGRNLPQCATGRNLSQCTTGRNMSHSITGRNMSHSITGRNMPNCTTGRKLTSFVGECPRSTHHLSICRKYLPSFIAEM